MSMNAVYVVLLLFCADPGDPYTRSYRIHNDIRSFPRFHFSNSFYYFVNMSEATSYRFENNTENKSLQRALHRQKERIKYDELMATREGVVKNELLINQKAEWTEKLEEASSHRRMKGEKAAVKSEIAIAGKTLVAVRRAALRQLMDQEYAMYEKELQAQGKAFYFKRD